MARPRILPDAKTLRRWVEVEHLTHAQIAERISKDTGEPVARSTVSAALSRAGLTGTRPRYKLTLPWTVTTIHLAEYPARMLRLLGRRLQGERELNDEETRRLDSWLAMLEAEQLVVAYDPNNLEQGFHYIDRGRGDGKDGIPIRRHTVQTLTAAQYAAQRAEQ